MNQKCGYVLLCALFASTLVHELGAKSHPVQPSYVRAKRDIGGNIDLHLNLEITSIGGHYVVRNTTSNSALIVDVQNKIFALLNGDGAEACIDLSKSKVAMGNSGFWYAKSHSLSKWMGSFDYKIVDFFKLKNVQQFPLSKVPQEFLDLVYPIIIEFVFDFIQNDLRGNKLLALNLIASDVGGMIKELTGRLSGLNKLIGDSQIPLNVDLNGLLNVLQGLTEFISPLNETVASLWKRGVILNASKILGAINGAHCLAELIRSIGSRMKLNNVAHLLNNLDSLCLIISKLGGHITVGLNGLSRVIGLLVKYHNKEISLDYVIGYMAQYVAYSREAVVGDITDELRTQVVINAIKSTGNRFILGDALKYLVAVTSSKLTYAGCNISAIITKLATVNVNTKENPIAIICSVIILLKELADPTESILSLLFDLVAKLQSPGGVTQIRLLGIQLDYINVFRIRKDIVNASINFSTNKMYVALRKSSIIGSVIKALNTGLSLAGFNTNLWTLLNDLKGSVRDATLGFLKVATSYPVDVHPSILIQSQKLLALHSSIGSFVTVSIQNYAGCTSSLP